MRFLKKMVLLVSMAGFVSACSNESTEPERGVWRPGKEDNPYATCVGKCGTKKATKAGCFCDLSCLGFGDCCPDIVTVCPTKKACPEAPESFYVSSSTVEALDGSLSSLKPPCTEADAGHDCEYYLDDSSCLGEGGPMGAYGPLGILGPIGDNSWNASAWIGAAGDWSEWAEDMKLDGGPMSQDGPLGPKGPLGDYAYFVTLPGINDWSKQLQAGGVWTVLGPLGPFGPLGPLGPLGPIGGHGYEADDNGNWVHDGQTVRTYDVPYTLSKRGSVKTFELVERYDEDWAKAMEDNDTSCMIEGGISPSSEKDSFTFTAAAKQVVTILVVPVAQLDDFGFAVTDAAGDEILSANSSDYIDWAQFKASAGMQFGVSVHLSSSLHWFAKSYRLVVVGSTEHFQETDICGDHQVVYNPPQ